MRVLLVEDDLMIGAAVEQALHDAAHAVDWVHNGSAAIAHERRQRYDVVLLDLNLPYVDGVAVLQILRRSADGVPILVITARDACEDRVRGLDLGADDYLVKPFAVAELLARMRAVVRRGDVLVADCITNGAIGIDRSTRQGLRGDERHCLTHREFALLLTLLEHAGVVLSRAQLEHHVYGWEDAVDSNAVEYLIHSLRKKLGMDSIRNVRGMGWMVDRTR